MSLGATGNSSRHTILLSFIQFSAFWLEQESENVLLSHGTLGFTQRAEHTKTFHDRIIPISSKATAVLQTIKSTQESDKWIFMRNGERMTTRQAAYILKLFADENGSKVKSSHKLRKTCGSNLYKHGANIKQCADFLGNSIAVFERNYCFDTDTDEVMRRIVEVI